MGETTKTVRIELKNPRITSHRHDAQNFRFIEAEVWLDGAKDGNASLGLDENEGDFGGDGRWVESVELDGLDDEVLELMHRVWENADLKTDGPITGTYVTQAEYVVFNED